MWITLGITCELKKGGLTKLNQYVIMSVGLLLLSIDKKPRRRTRGFFVGKF